MKKRKMFWVLICVLMLEGGVLAVMSVAVPESGVYGRTVYRARAGGEVSDGTSYKAETGEEVSEGSADEAGIDEGGLEETAGEAEKWGEAEKRGETSDQSGKSGEWGETSDQSGKSGEWGETPDQSGKSGKREQEVRNIYKKNKKNLVLVNAEHGLEESYDASLRTICNGRLRASSRLYSPLAEMLEAASDEGHHYFIASAWRSRERQQKLVDEDVRKEMGKGLSYGEALKEVYRETMPAGHSEHETGLALDILCVGNLNMDASQEKEPANIWLRKNSWRYGFVLRYPKEKKKITGINYEPWHFRYVGKAAEYMHEHGLVLEEFWDMLTEGS